MLAYTKSITKEQFVNETKWHQQQDNFIKGTYEQDVKGCAVGCAIYSINKLRGVNESRSNHSVYETYLGIPEWLARLEDLLFENLSLERSKTWPVEFAEAINEGADLDKIKVPFLTFVLEFNIKTMEEQLKKHNSDDVKRSIKDVIKVNKQVIEALQSGDEKQLKAAESAAWAAAWAAAEAAAEAAAWAAEAEAAAEAEGHKIFANELLKLMRECK